MILALMKKELLALSRDLHGMVALFVMPMVFIIVMSMALKDVYAPSAKPLAYAVQNNDGGARLAAVLLDRWTKESGPAQPLSADWQAELRAGTLQYVLVVDAGFSKNMADNQSSGADTSSGAAQAQDQAQDQAQARVHLLAEPGMGQSMFEWQRSRLLSAVAQLRAEVLLAQLDLDVDVAALVQRTPATAERIAGTGVRPTSVQQNVPAWLVFGMFFVVASIAGLFVEERSSGALARLRSLGARPWQLIVGKIVPYLLVNAVQAALMLAVGIWLMPLIGGEALSLAGVHAGALVLVLAALSFAAVSLALCLACLVRTHGQAGTVGPAVNVLMAALGGIMVPTFIMPAAMQTVAALSPMNWGLEGMLDVMLRGGDIAAVLPQAGKLALFGLVMLAVSFRLFGRRA